MFKLSQTTNWVVHCFALSAMPTSFMSGKSVVFIAIVGTLLLGQAVCQGGVEGGASTNSTPKKYSKEGVYVRGYYVNNSIGGDFNDTIILNSSDLIVDVPAIEDGGGWGIAVGTRSEGSRWGGGMEVGFSRSTHDTFSSLLGSSEASFWALDMAFLVDVKTVYGLRPYGVDCKLKCPTFIDCECFMPPAPE